MDRIILLVLSNIIGQKKNNDHECVKCIFLVLDDWLDKQRFNGLPSMFA